MKALLVTSILTIAVTSVAWAQNMTTNVPDPSNVSRGDLKTQPTTDAATNNSGETVPGNTTTGVNERSASASGSPGELSGNNGESPDGTNTVQRATLNIAGSPLPGGPTPQSLGNKRGKNNDPRRNQSEDVEGKKKDKVKSSTEHINRQQGTNQNKSSGKKNKG